MVRLHICIQTQAGGPDYIHVQYCTVHMYVQCTGYWYAWLDTKLARHARRLGVIIEQTTNRSSRCSAAVAAATGFAQTAAGASGHATVRYATAEAHAIQVDIAV